MAREYNPMKKAQEAIELDDVADAIVLQARRHIPEFKKLEKKGYKLILYRRPYNEPWTDGNSEEIRSNRTMRLYNSRYVWEIGPSINGEFTDKQHQNDVVITLAQFNINQLHSCCAAVVFSNAWIHEAIRSKGLGSLLHKWRLYLAEKHGGYSIALCTIVTNDLWEMADGKKYTAQESILRKNGWELTQHITNPKSTSDVGLFVRRLNTEGYRS